MEVFKGILCISGSELIRDESNPNGIMSESMYKKLAHTQRSLNVLRRSCKGTPSLIEYRSLPQRYRDAWESLHGDPQQLAAKTSYVGQIRVNPNAVSYFCDYKYGADDKILDYDVAMRYAREAAVLDMLNTVNVRSKEGSKLRGRTQRIDWGAAVTVVHSKEIQSQYPHQLPTNPQSLMRKLKKYLAEGYAGLVHAGYGNDNSRIVTVLLERLVLALYTMPNKPFNTTVYDNVNLFLNGKISLYDKKTGELFDHLVFYKNGQPLEIAESTVWGIINNPLNRIFVDEQRNDSFYNLNNHRPYQRRHSPDHSFSKITMDDRDLPRKLHGGGRVKAYYAYDVTSGAVVGTAYSRTKDEELFLDCLRDLFRNMERNGWGMPAEVEVENHLVRKFFDDLQVMFTFLKICIPGNHREKRAEHFNKMKKYGAEKKAGHKVGRWYLSEPYLISDQKINDEIVEKTFSYDDLVADDLASIRDHNLGKHKLKKFDGKSRWQVLTDCLNPDLLPAKRSILARYVGYKTNTSIRNSKEVQVQGLHFQLSHVNVMAKLKPNNQKVTAYYLPDDEKKINEVYIYQDDVFISECKFINPYNEARVEWTEEDKDSFISQSKFDAQYRKEVKTSKEEIPKIDIINMEGIREYEPKEKVVRQTKKTFDPLALIAEYDSNKNKENAIKSM